MVAFAALAPAAMVAGKALTAATVAATGWDMYSTYGRYNQGTSFLNSEEDRVKANFAELMSFCEDNPDDEKCKQLSNQGLDPKMLMIGIAFLILMILIVGRVIIKIIF